MVIPYTQGVAESFKKICGKYWIQTHFKGNTTIKQLLMKPKDQDPKDKKSGVICSYQCEENAWDEEYIGKHHGPWVRDTWSISHNPLQSMCISYRLDTPQHQTISTSLGGKTRAWPGP